MSTLCKLADKKIEKNFKEIVKLVKKPKFICEKCARCSNDKDALCRPVKLKKDKKKEESKNSKTESAVK
ncbi:MAG: hypothetical protein WCR55_03245 [Lentisphaerota bacterium]